ncbi:MAG: CAP domain-containing protein [Verrucomicrobia bacterium]|nr:CAP domain-containing protein [Verrucomicrobiota bacterium]
MKLAHLLPGLLASATVSQPVVGHSEETTPARMRFVTEKREPSGLAERFTPEQFAAALLAETNRVRVAHGRRPLTPLPALQAAADDQARMLALSGRCEHFSPLAGQHTPLERAQRHGLDRGRIGENVLAMSLRLLDDAPPSCASVAADAVVQWMNSPGHRANLLNRDFTHFGGAVQLAPPLGASAERIYGVQVFAGP